LQSKLPPALQEYADERDLDAFWREARPRREPVGRRWFVPSILVLLALSIPWYVPTELVARVVGGLPLWTWIALACSMAVAGITAWVGIAHWDDDV
jgi:hypothetical protein